MFHSGQEAASHSAGLGQYWFPPPRSGSRKDAADGVAFPCLSTAAPPVTSAMMSSPPWPGSEFSSVVDSQ